MSTIGLFTAVLGYLILAIPLSLRLNLTLVKFTKRVRSVLLTNVLGINGYPWTLIIDCHLLLCFLIVLKSISFRFCDRK